MGNTVHWTLNSIVCTSYRTLFNEQASSLQIADWTPNIERGASQILCVASRVCVPEHCSLSRLFRRCITPRSDSLRQTMLFHLKPILHEEAFPGHQYVATSPARYLSNIRLLKLSLKLLSLLSLKFSPPPQLDNCATLGCWSWRLWRPWQWLLHTLMHLLHVAYVAHVLHMCSLMY